MKIFWHTVPAGKSCSSSGSLYQSTNGSLLVSAEGLSIRARLDDGFFEVPRKPFLAPQTGHAASVPENPGFDNGSVNEIFWYGTFGMIEPRAPRLS